MHPPYPTLTPNPALHPASCPVYFQRYHIVFTYLNIQYATNAHTPRIAHMSDVTPHMIPDPILVPPRPATREICSAGYARRLGAGQLGIGWALLALHLLHLSNSKSDPNP